ncbi:hypothetical protein K1719_003822 [Acacia pycnantha]|nr:hypothetical protein K1719_003822 [Acacia pycnantha]
MIFNFHIHPKVWRFLGFVSCVVGFICYAFSPSFHNLFGHWTLFKILFYSILSSIFSLLTLFVNKCPPLSRVSMLQAHLGFLTLMLTSLYSFYEDRSKQHDEEDEKGRRNMLSLVSFAAFAFMSVSLSKQIQPEFDVGMSSFFLGCLIVAVMKINIKIAIGLSALFYVLVTVRSCWDSQQIIGDTQRAIIMAPLNEMQITLAGENVDEECHIEMPSLDNEGHMELDATEEVQEETKCGHIDELGIWFQAFLGSRQDDEHQMLIMDATLFLA